MDDFILGGLIVLLVFAAGYLIKQDPRDKNGRFKKKQWWEK